MSHYQLFSKPITSGLTFGIIAGLLFMTTTNTATATTATASETHISTQPQTAYDISLPAIDGTSLALSAYRGKPILVVNTASQCGFTPQYDALQALYEAYKDHGLMVIGVPSNDFGRQEKGTSDEIQSFCEVNFGITFPLADKVSVKGDDAHIFYQWAKAQVGFAGRPRWNFHKYLIGTDGMVADWFATTTNPDSPKIIKAIEAQLSR